MGDGRQSATTSADTARELRIMRVLDEYTRRRDAGDFVPPDEFLAAHPDLAPDLGEHLSLIEQFSPGPDQLEHLIALGLLRRSEAPGYAAALGPCLVERVIGRGGMGVVLKAHDAELGRDVAVKILHPERVHDPSALLRFQREARAAAGLRHPNIVTVYAVGREGAAHYIAMEYVAGPSLAELIRQRGPLPAETAREVFRQLLAALAAAHEAGLVHRDVKSSNILLDVPVKPGARGSGRADAPADSLGSAADGSSARSLDPSIPGSLTVKLADFGLARVLASSTQLTLTQAILGTPEYMSPEQARGEEVDHRTDLYSAGVVLYEMLTGTTPFKADTPTATLRKILDEEPRDPRTLDRSVDPALATLALRLMAKRREERFTLAVGALALLEGRGAPRLTGRPGHRRRVLLALAAVVATALAVVGLARQALRGGQNVASINSVRIDPDTRQSIQVCYGRNAAWQRFGSLGDCDECQLRAVALVDVDGHGRQLVVATLDFGLDTNCDSLVAWNAPGEVVWRTTLGSESVWPDTRPSRVCWKGDGIASAQLDEEPGEELVVTSNHPDEYPCRITLVDPRNGSPRRTFWHCGHVTGTTFLPGYFADGRAALAAWGQANKLDGFDDARCPVRSGPAHWDIVWFVMILDPLQMDGLGPTHPGTCLALPAGLPTAYALLDLPTATGMEQRSPDSGPAPAGKPDLASAGIIVTIHAVRRDDRPGRSADGPFLRVILRPGADNPTQVTLPSLIVDRSLQLVDVTALPVNEPLGELGSLGLWQGLWRTLVRDGHNVLDE